MAAAKDLEIAVIGAGFAGICMAMRLKRAGYRNFTLYEKAAAPGGTWRDNTYPGCECDVPSHLYSFSFENKADWSRSFAGQPEILEYIRHLVRKYDLERRIQYNTEISSARFNERSGKWEIGVVGNGRKIEADVLVAAVGQLNRPFTPDIPGRESFEGVQFHSAQWNHSRDLTGREVAVVGNAASALQLIPEVAKQTKKLTVFQRTPNWVVPKPLREFNGLEKILFKYVPPTQRLYRWSIWLRLEFSFAALHKDSFLSRVTKAHALRFLKQEVRDPELRKKLTPDYPPGCKRILMSNDYYAALVRPDVELVTEPIREIAPGGIVTADGRLHRADTIVFATGFRTTDFLAPMHIEGRGGKKLEQLWNEGALAHRGVTVAGFPNFFMLYGPNTNLGHNSILFMIEQQTRYAVACLDRLRARGLKFVDTRPRAMERYNRRLQEEMKGTVWVAGCPSWYQNPSGRVTNNWPYRTLRYWIEMRRPRPQEFDWVG